MERQVAPGQQGGREECHDEWERCGRIVVVVGGGGIWRDNVRITTIWLRSFADQTIDGTIPVEEEEEVD